MEAGAGDELGVVSQGRWYVLAETEDGYGIWRSGQPRSDPALAEFAGDADGFADADREYRRLDHWMRVHHQLPRVLSWIVFVAAPIWVLATSIDTLWSYLATGTSGLGSGPPVWVGVLAQFAQPLWEGALAVMLALWLLRRAQELRRHA